LINYLHIKNSNSRFDVYEIRVDIEKWKKYHLNRYFFIVV